MEKVRDIRKSFRIFAIVVTVLLVAFLALRKDNIFRWIEAKVTISNQNRQIRSLENDIRELDEQTRMLTSDKDSLEKFARENFRFSEPEEDVYIVE